MHSEPGRCYRFPSQAKVLHPPLCRHSPQPQPSAGLGPMASETVAAEAATVSDLFIFHRKTNHSEPEVEQQIRASQMSPDTRTPTTALSSHSPRPQPSASLGPMAAEAGAAADYTVSDLFIFL